MRGKKISSSFASGRKRNVSKTIRWRSLGFSLALVLAERSVEAASKYPVVCDSDDPTRCTQPIVRGEIAPFDGQLLNTEKAIQLGQVAAHCEDRIELERTRTSSLAMIELGHAKELYAIDLRALARERDLYKGLYAAKPIGLSWYEQPMFIVPATIVVTLGAVYLATRVVEIGGK